MRFSSGPQHFARSTCHRPPRLKRFLTAPNILSAIIGSASPDLHRDPRLSVDLRLLLSLIMVDEMMHLLAPRHCLAVHQWPGSDCLISFGPSTSSRPLHVLSCPFEQWITPHLLGGITDTQVNPASYQGVGEIFRHFQKRCRLRPVSALCRQGVQFGPFITQMIRLLCTGPSSWQCSLHPLR